MALAVAFLAEEHATPLAAEGFGADVDAQVVQHVAQFAELFAARQALQQLDLAARHSIARRQPSISRVAFFRFLLAFVV